MKRPDNPFLTTEINGFWYGAADATDRIAMVKRFNLKQCRAALKVPGLQKTVERAIQVRIRKLEKEL